MVKKPGDLDELEQRRRGELDAKLLRAATAHAAMLAQRLADAERDRDHFRARYERIASRLLDPAGP